MLRAPRFSFGWRTPTRTIREPRAQAAKILSEPQNYPYGERQYSAVDLGVHRWTFSQSIADVDPAEWGGTLKE